MFIEAWVFHLCTTLCFLCYFCLQKTATRELGMKMMQETAVQGQSHAYEYLHWHLVNKQREERRQRGSTNREERATAEWSRDDELSHWWANKRLIHCVCIRKRAERITVHRKLHDTSTTFFPCSPIQTIYNSHTLKSDCVGQKYRPVLFTAAALIY